MQEEAARLSKALDLGRWTIDVSIGRCEGQQSVAEIVVLADYGIAAVVLDHLKHDNLDEMRRNLRHEFIHILLAPMSRFRDIIAEANGEDFRSMDKTWESLEEQTVTRLERTDIGKTDA